MYPAVFVHTCTCPAHCPSEAEYNSVLGHTFNWTETTVGQVRHIPCPCKSTLDITRDTYATRACMNGGKWRDTDDRECSAPAVMELCKVCVSGQHCMKVHLWD